MKKKSLNKPYGNKLVDLMAKKSELAGIYKRVYKYPSWYLTKRQIYDLELLLNGGFSPLRGFMSRDNYLSVIKNMRLKNGMLWPIPVYLDVDKSFAKKASKSDYILLLDGEGIPIAYQKVQSIFNLNKKRETLNVYNTTDLHHPGVEYVFKNTGTVCIGGEAVGINRPHHHSFNNIRHTPKSLRKIFVQKGWSRIVAFQTRNPMHRIHFELTKFAGKSARAKILIHPSVGPTKPGDLSYYLRVRTYKKIMNYYSKDSAMLSLLPLSMRMAGPKEAVWHAIIRKNYGCSHFVVGRDHAGPGNGSNGDKYYREDDAQKLLDSFSNELGIEIVPFQEIVYLPEMNKYVPLDKVPKGKRYLNFSGTKIRDNITNGRRIPEWMTFPEVATEMKKVYPARHKQGFTIFFTGLSGSGKSTIAKLILSKLLEKGDRPVTLLDGDVVRRHLSSELGFSKKHRDINVRRIGFVASEITKNRGIAICAPIAPYESTRKEVKEMISQYGGFILAYVSTPLSVCEKRDVKGLYAMARAGKIKKFTGISDPYEAPKDADIVVDTSRISSDKAVELIFTYLKKEKYIKA